MLLISHNSVDIDIFHTFKNISLHKWIDLFQIPDQFLDLHTLGTILIIASSTGIRKFAGTLDKMKIIVISPCLDRHLPAPDTKDESVPFPQN